MVVVRRVPDRGSDVRCLPHLSQRSVLAETGGAKRIFPYPDPDETGLVGRVSCNPCNRKDSDAVFLRLDRPRGPGALDYNRVKSLCQRHGVRGFTLGSSALLPDRWEGEKMRTLERDNHN